jgi:hypothetical protein
LTLGIPRLPGGGFAPTIDRSAIMKAFPYLAAVLSVPTIVKSTELRDMLTKLSPHLNPKRGTV